MAFHPTRIRWIRELLCWLVACIRPEKLKTRPGFKLWIPKQDKSIYVVDLFITGYYEKQESELVGTLLASGDTVVDVGANVGYYTCLFSDLVGESGNVYSFEPVIDNLSALRRNIEINQLNNVVVFDDALGDVSSSEKIYLSHKNRGTHSLVADSVDGDTWEDIEIKRFDQVVPEEKICLVKVDVEGYELSVLLGMQNHLDKKLIQYLFVEFTPYKVCLNDQNPESLLDYLDSYNSEIHVISNTIDQPACEIEDIKRDLDRHKRDKTATFNLLVRFPV